MAISSIIQAPTPGSTFPRNNDENPVCNRCSVVPVFCQQPDHRAGGRAVFGTVELVDWMLGFDKSKSN